MLVSAVCLIIHSNRYATATTGTAMYSPVLPPLQGVPALTPQTRSSRRPQFHTTKKETVTLGFFPWTLHHRMAQLWLHITHSKAQVTIAVVGRHTSPFHGGETALSGLPHANATRSDSSVPITCLPYYPQQGPWNRSSQTHRWFSCLTFVHQNVALTFLGRHKLTSVHLAREVMAGSSLKVQLSKRVAYLERTGKGLLTGA